MTFFLLFLMSSESGTAHFTVSTINVRGLNDPLQRRHIFQSLINSNFDSYCLQETHGKSDTINAWKKEWPGRSFWCPTNNPRSSGVAILLHPNCQAELVEKKYDEDGRRHLVTCAPRYLTDIAVPGANEDPNVGLEHEVFGHLADA